MSPVRTSGTAAGAAPRRAPASRPAPRRPPHLRVVPDPHGGRRRALTRACTALAVVMSAVGLFLVVFLQVLLTQGQAELDGLDARADEAAAQNRRLRVAVAELESPDRIVGVARQRLGMVPPGAVTYLQAVGPSDPLPPVPAGPPPAPAATVAAPPSAVPANRAPATTAPARRSTTATTAHARRSTTATTAVTATTATTAPAAPGAAARRTTPTTTASRR